MIASQLMPALRWSCPCGTPMLPQSQGMVAWRSLFHFWDDPGVRPAKARGAPVSRESGAPYRQSLAG
ncbi:MAG: hypothetical protein KatS3mg111_0870 [Pirellulaceae bacterium]|nr:MAG: hypothetical protein KatS3mg111_0870 [Pirellulaceae bacterium]